MIDSEDWLFGSGDGLDGVVLPEFTSNSNRWMTLPEERSLALSMPEIERGIDPLFFSMMLYREGLLPEEVYKRIMGMIQNCCERKIMCRYLFEQIRLYINLENLVTILEKCEYISLSTLLLVNSFKWNHSYAVVQRSESSNPTAYCLYSNIKRLVNNAQLKAPGTFLRKMAEKCYGLMVKETDPERKQKLADNCEAIICAETDIIAITFDEKLCQHELFDQLKSINKETSNTLIADVSCYGRHANAYAIAGDYDTSEEMLNEAKCKAYIIGPCIEFVHFMYIVAYVFLWKFEKYPTPDLRAKILRWCRVGLKCVEEDYVENKNKWRRILMLRMAFCLLGLGNRATVIANYCVDGACIAEARAILAEFDKYWKGIEKRREMFYYVARARLCELESHHQDSLKYLRLAHTKAVKGRFKEKRYIKEYYLKVFWGETRRRSQAQWCQVPCNQRCKRLDRLQVTGMHSDEDESERYDTCIGAGLGSTIPKRRVQQNFRNVRKRPDPIGGPSLIQMLRNSSHEMQNRKINQFKEAQPDSCELKNPTNEQNTEWIASFDDRSPPSGDSQPDSIN